MRRAFGPWWCWVLFALAATAYYLFFNQLPASFRP
jgi:hypothetical protein